MASTATFEQDDGGWRRWAGYAVPAILLLGAAWAIWTFAHQVDGVRREAPSISTLIPVQEPPPPPPPKIKPPPEPKPIDEPVPQPTPQPPTPTPTPQSPSPAQPTAGQNAVTQNAPAQAGSDAFNIGAGDGSGGRGAGTGGGGGGFAETAATYGQYAKGLIVRAVRSSTLLKGKELRADVRVWVDAQGKVSRMEFNRATGTGAYDAELRRLLLAMEGLRPPAAAVLSQMPIHFSIDERRPL